MARQLFRESQSKKAISYSRRSTRDMQEYSIEIQQDAAKEYADQNNVEIIHSLEDKHTGLVADRPGFQSLINDWVKNPNAPEFDYVLVYDDSRWGRFDDSNEAGHYEFVCKEHGKKVLYTSEPFPKEDDNQTFSGVIRSLKRASASEYSRDLSKKVFNGCIKITSKGYSVGGIAPYGYARLLLDEQKQPERILKKGQRKALANGRIVFVPANDESTETVKKIFKLFDLDNTSPNEIARGLDNQGIKSPGGGEWNSSKIVHVLSNETYRGTLLYNKTSNKLKRGYRRNQRKDWVIVEKAFEPIINDEMFYRVQEKLYWLLPSRSNKGVYKIRKAEKQLRKDLEEYLLEKRIDEEGIYFVLKNLPVYSSVAFYSAENSRNKHWCFSIPDSARKYDYILGVGVDKDGDNLIENFFLIPTNSFSLSGHFIFSENDKEYATQKIEEGEITNKIDLLIKAVVHDTFFENATALGRF